MLTIIAAIRSWQKNVKKIKNKNSGSAWKGQERIGKRGIIWVGLENH